MVQRKDLVELRRHVYANSIDRHVIRKLLQKVFVSCACEHNLQLKYGQHLKCNDKAYNHH